MPRKYSSCDIAAVLEQAAHLSQRAAELAATGAITEALALEDEADQLRAGARRVARAAEAAAVSHLEGGLSVRQTAIGSLNEIGVPASPRVVADYAKARFGA